MVIDLDERPPAAAPAGRASRTAVPAALVVVLLLTLTLAGSAAPLPRPSVLLTTGTLVDTHATAPDALFTAEPGTPFRSAVVRRLDLPGGDEAWSAELPQTAGVMQYAEPAGVLVVTAQDGQRTTFVEGATGRVLWRTETGVFRLTGDGALIGGGNPGVPEISLVDLRTGAARWTAPSAARGRIDAGESRFAPPEHILLVDHDGHATVRGLADGRVLATAVLDVPGDHRETEFAAVGGRFYVSSAGTLTAFGADFKELWRTATGAPRPHQCGPDLCVAGPDGLSLLDAATGTVRWSNPRWEHGVDSRLLGLPGPARIVAQGGPADRRQVLLDPADGEPVDDVGRGVFAGPYVLQRDPGRPQRTVLRESASGLGLRTTGSLADVVPERCSAVPGTVACATTGGRVAVWRIPTSSSG